MKISLTPGKWRGLQLTSTDAHIFTILAFDQRGSYRRMLPQSTSYAQAVAIKREVVAALSPHTSAVLLDPVYGLDAAMHMSGRSGWLMALEKTGYSGQATARQVDFIEGWSVEKIKRAGASAVKLLVYYHPDAGALTEQIEATVRQVAEDCRRYDLPLFVEPLSYSLDPSVPKASAAFAEQRPRIVQQTVHRLSRLGVDVMKMEFPVDVNFERDPNAWRAACDALSEASATPWVLLSAGVDFETFEQQARVAFQAGASGFLAGRAIWKECVPMSAEERAQFLAQTATERVHRLSALAAEFARPWSDFFTPPSASEGWFAGYAGFEEG